MLIATTMGGAKGTTLRDYLFDSAEDDDEEAVDTSTPPTAEEAREAFGFNPITGT